MEFLFFSFVKPSSVLNSWNDCMSNFTIIKQCLTKFIILECDLLHCSQEYWLINGWDLQINGLLTH